MQEPDIFVFGPNLAGRHGKGAAAFARRHRGAEIGQDEGRQGDAYALPTKDKQLRRLSLQAIEDAVIRFLDHARQNANLSFQVTRVGCGLAGYNDDQMARLFLDRPLHDNCLLPGVWLRRRDPFIMRVIVAGSRTFGHVRRQRRKMFHDLDRLRDQYPDRQLTIISGGAAGADSLGACWATTRGVHCERFPAQWKRYGKVAGFVRNQLMAWYGTHLVAYWDGQSKGTRHMLETARQDGLTTWMRPFNA